MGGVKPIQNNWFCNTNFVQNNAIDNSIFCSNLNVEFLLEKRNTDGTYSIAKTFWARNCSLNTYVGSDQENISLENDDFKDSAYYRMSIVLWFPDISLNPLEYRTDPATDRMCAPGCRLGL